MINLTLDQANTALECVQNDIDLSAFGQVDFKDIAALQFYLRRAELLQRLQAAIRAVQD